MSEYASIVASRIPSLYQKKYYLAVLVIGILKKFKILMSFLVFFFIFCVNFIRPKILTNENCLIVLVESHTVKLVFFSSRYIS